MSTPAINVEGLWKEYVVDAASQRHSTFYDLLAHSIRAPFSRLRKIGHQAHAAEQFWALRDVSFEVPMGEVLGIIGRNGAGKSTLLKILSRITAPTRGRVTVHGRMTSLLEVGTGFHPELSGRENVYLNGAILGMGRAEISRKFDEIVEFAEVARFIDTPVKRYSSGMYVRLAFAVAAHLEPEVLVIDEVLAVGDAGFQKRCLGKMKDVAEQGRTVLFVSHNMGAVSRLCSRAIWLDGGEFRIDGPCHYVLDQYDRSISAGTGRGRSNAETGSKPATLSGLRILDASGLEKEYVDTGSPSFFEIRGYTKAGLADASLAVGVYDEEGRRLCLLDSETMDCAFDLASGEFVINCRINDVPLFPGRYALNVALKQRQSLVDAIERCAILSVRNRDFFPTGKLPQSGPLMLQSAWASGTVFKRLPDS